MKWEIYRPEKGDDQVKKQNDGKEQVNGLHRCQYKVGRKLRENMKQLNESKSLAIRKKNWVVALMGMCPVGHPPPIHPNICTFFRSLLSLFICLSIHPLLLRGSEELTEPYMALKIPWRGWEGLKGKDGCTDGCMEIIMCPTETSSLLELLPCFESNKSTNIQPGNDIADHYWPRSVFF